jgi:hypothetical protein
VRLAVLLSASLLLAPVCLVAQQVTARPVEPSTDQHSDQHDHSVQALAGGSTSSWTVDVDGVLFATFNRQGGLRGKTEFGSQNWLMAMTTRPLGSTSLTLTAMGTGEPFTLGRSGYSEIFQEGESYHALQITDRQHPHDLFMQFAGAWTVPLGGTTRLTFAGGPVGEASLGPVAFMHRASSAENPVAPLSHHTFDSTHTVSDVALARVDLGKVSLEGSAFHGREPDEHRYDLEFGALDSWATRVWLRPSPAWAIQGSYGFLHQPERLEPGDQRRANASASWFRSVGDDYTAVTVAVGRTERQFSTTDAVLAEATHHVHHTSIYARFERLTVETEILLFPQVVHVPHRGELVDPIIATTIGGVRDLKRIGPLSVGLGGDVTFYNPPSLLQITHGERPASFHIFMRVARSADRGRMWNGTMASHAAAHREHAEHDHSQRHH